VRFIPTSRDSERADDVPARRQAPVELVVQCQDPVPLSLQLPPLQTSEKRLEGDETDHETPGGEGQTDRKLFPGGYEEAQQDQEDPEQAQPDDPLDPGEGQGGHFENPSIDLVELVH
jgi:hypothetical protein